MNKETENLRILCQKLQAENARLWECVVLYATTAPIIIARDMGLDSYDVGAYARQCLAEIGGKDGS